MDCRKSNVTACPVAERLLPAVKAQNVAPPVARAFRNIRCRKLVMLAVDWNTSLTAIFRMGRLVTAGPVVQ